MNFGWLRIGLLLTLAALLNTGCVGPRQGLFPPKPAEPKKSVYVVNHGWHTGVVVKREDIPSALWPEKADFPEAVFIEVGWGDDAWYRAERGTISLGFKAMFMCDRSVLHVAGFKAPPAEFFPGSQVIRVDLSEAGFTNLCGFISSRFERNGAERAKPVQEGLYGHSYFYHSTGRYYFLKTCNLWTARALRSAGCPITPLYAVPAGNVMCQTRRFGTVVRSD